MNDGSTDYRNHHAVDSLAFGHCEYAYRNLGRPSQILVKQEAGSFEVEVDGRKCISSDKVHPSRPIKFASTNIKQIRLPPDYYFGITAASADTPDTFEVYKFVTTTSSAISREEPRKYEAPPPGQQDQQYQQPPQYQPAQQPADTKASDYASQAAQFEDLHTRLQVMAHAIDNIQQAVMKLTGDSEGRHREMARNVMSADQLNAMDTRIKGIETTVREYQREFSSLQSILKESHGNLMQGLPAHMTDSESILVINNCQYMLTCYSHAYKVSSSRPLHIHARGFPNPVGWFVYYIQAKKSARAEEVFVIIEQRMLVISVLCVPHLSLELAVLCPSMLAQVPMNAVNTSVSILV